MMFHLPPLFRYFDRLFIHVAHRGEVHAHGEEKVAQEHDKVGEAGDRDCPMHSNDDEKTENDPIRRYHEDGWNKEIPEHGVHHGDQDLNLGVNTE